MKKILSFAYFFICATMLFSVTALAYIDPSAMTYMIQLVAGIAIAAGAGVGFYFRKIRRRLSKYAKKDRTADFQSYDDDDDDMTGFGDYEIEDTSETAGGTYTAAPGQPAADRAAVTAAGGMSAMATGEGIRLAASLNPSAARPSGAASAYESLAEACSTCDRAVPAPDPYDETGGEGGLLAENQRLRRLLLEEQQKVEQLKQALHICTAPRK